MWNNTAATKKLGIKYPIIQGPFGGHFSSTKLSAIVSNLGGLGSFGLNAYTAEEIIEIDKELKSLTKNAYALNLWVPLKNDPAKDYTSKAFEKVRAAFKAYFDRYGIALPEMQAIKPNTFEAQIEAVLQAKPPVMSFIFGIPDRAIIKALQASGTVVIATATTLEEAILIEEAGIDLIVATGAEAGGHRASFLRDAEDSLRSTATLLREIKGKINIPVIAAGGISDGESAFRAMQMGASAVQIGTAFLACKESNAPEIHKEKLFSKPLTTDLTRAYTGRLARAVANKFMEEMKGLSKEEIAPFPIQSSFLSPVRKVLLAQNKTEYLAFWSGQPNAPLVHKSAKSLFKDLVDTLHSLDENNN